MSGDAETPAVMTRVEAMRALIRWAGSESTARALDAIELLDISDSDLENLFRRSRRVVRLPHLGKIS